MPQAQKIYSIKPQQEIVKPKEQGGYAGTKEIQNAKHPRQVNYFPTYYRKKTTKYAKQIKHVKS